MTQSVFGRSDCSRLARFDFWGRFAVSVMPGRTSVRPRPGCWASGAPAQGPLSLLWPHCGLQTFPAPAPTRSFPVGASGARSRVSAHSCPNSAPSATRAGEGTPVWLGSSHRGNPGSRSHRRSFEKPRDRARRGQLAGRPWPCSLPRRYLLACGGVPGQPASPGAVSPRNCPCWLLRRAPCTGGGRLVRCFALLPRTASSRINGSCRQASGTPRPAPGGALYPSAGFATNFAGKGREGSGRLPSRVPGGRARGARDGARPETSSAGGAERGGGHRRGYSRLAQGSRLGPAPQSLSLTCLTPPQPGPAPCRWLAVPEPPPPPSAPGAHVTDGTRPLGPGLIFSLASPRVRTAPRPHPARCPPRRSSPG